MFKQISSKLVLNKHCVNVSALFSTAAIPERVKSFRTSQDNPVEHGVGNIGQFYRIIGEENCKLFTHGGIPKSYKIQAKTFAEMCIMVRGPAIDIINCIKNQHFEGPAVRFVLYGKKGSGKSLTLAHILHFGLQSGFVLLHVPWVGRWMRYCKENSNSEFKEGLVDINVDAANWLLHFKTQNAHHLSKSEFIIGEDYQWTKREMTKKGSPLTELIDHGINRVKYASECVVSVCKEIKRLSNEGKCKTLVAIDGYNAFFFPKTRVYTEKKEMVPPERVTLTSGFLEVTQNDWKNGVCVLTVDEIAIPEEDQISYLPKYLLGKTGFKHLDPFIPIHIDGYTPKELLSCIEYYKERKWVRSVIGQNEELAFLSASNPYKLMELCNPL